MCLSVSRRPLLEALSVLPSLASLGCRGDKPASPGRQRQAAAAPAGGMGMRVGPGAAQWVEGTRALGLLDGEKLRKGALTAAGGATDGGTEQLGGGLRLHPKSPETWSHRQRAARTLCGSPELLQQVLTADSGLALRVTGRLPKRHLAAWSPPGRAAEQLPPPNLEGATWGG